MPLVIALLIALGLGAAARAGRHGLISDHAYNNHYNDASAARQDRLG